MSQKPATAPKGNEAEHHPFGVPRTAQRKSLPLKPTTTSNSNDSLTCKSCWQSEGDVHHQNLESNQTNHKESCKTNICVLMLFILAFGAIAVLGWHMLDSDGETNQLNSRIKGLERLLSILVRANWNNWSAWSTCSATCGQGIATRTRTCFASDQYRETGCLGAETDSKTCDVQSCPAAHAFKVIKTKEVEYGNYSFLALKVEVPTDGQSRSKNWCMDYQYLCGDFSRRPTGCSHESSTVQLHDSIWGYTLCSKRYNSDMDIGDVLGCSPSYIASIAHKAFPSDPTPADANSNAFGFYKCKAEFCRRTIRDSEKGLAYMNGFWRSNIITMYTVCR